MIPSSNAVKCQGCNLTSVRRHFLVCSCAKHVKLVCHNLLSVSLAMLLLTCSTLCQLL